MAKRITQKEFFKVLADAGIAIHGYDEVLNMLSLFFLYDAEKTESLGINRLSEWDRERSSALYVYLRDRGYYDYN